MSLIRHIDEQSFAQVIAKGTVLVDFFAEWCGPCRMLTPILEQLAQEFQGSVTIAKVDVDQAQVIAVQYDITSVPTLILFQDGVMKHRVVGLTNLKSLQEMLRA
jgi:thioredoxin 1